jgi:hypothetical protein
MASTESKLDEVVTAMADRVSPPPTTPAQRLLAQTGWWLALVAVVGFSTHRSLLLLWVLMFTLGVAKVPADLWVGWRRRRMPTRREGRMNL